MKFLLAVMAALVLACNVSAADKPAPKAEKQADDLMVSMKSEVLNKYVFRGQLVNDDPVTQSTVTIKKGMFELAFFGNMDLTDINEDSGDFTEMDVRLGIDKQIFSRANGILRSVDVLAGVEYFSFPNTDRDSTAEVYAGARVTLPYNIVSETVAHLDVDEASGGVYLSEEIKRDFKLTKVSLFKRDFEVVATPKFGIGVGSAEYNENYWDVDEFCTSNLFAEIAVMLKNEKIEFGPSIRYVSVVGDDLRDEVVDNEHVVYGFSLGMKF